MADPAFRNGKQAIKDAKAACSILQWKEENTIDTLAAAYAETGDFDSAVQYASQALTIKDISSADSKRIQRHLELFQTQAYSVITFVIVPRQCSERSGHTENDTVWYWFSVHRIVSLLPAATEISAGLGLMNQVVGVSHECDFPSEANDRPRVTRCPVHETGLTSREVDEWVRRALHDNGTIYTLDEP